MCILAGCDFVASLPGMGIKKAQSNIKRLRSFQKVIKSVKFSGVKVPADYAVNVQRAFWTFCYQRCVHLPCLQRLCVCVYTHWLVW